MNKVIRRALAALLVSIALLSCGAPPKAAPARPLTVASKIDTEGSILGSMLLIRLSEAGIPVQDRLGFGPTDLVRKAIIAGEIDIYPEYTGNGAFFFPGTDPETWKDRTRALQTVRSLDKERNGLEWLESANANNTWAIAVRGDLARAETLRTLSELGAYIARGGDFKLAGSEEFVTRPDALPAFEAAYGFKLRKDQLVVLSGGNTATTEQAAARGTDGVNAAMAYGTDGQLAALGLVVLSDDKGVQPVYEPAPLVRADALAAYPNLGELLSPVFAALDLVTLQSLNAAVAVEGQDARTVALEWMRAKGLAK